jgi:hypothetical protein
VKNFGVFLLGTIAKVDTSGLVRRGEERGKGRGKRKKKEKISFAKKRRMTGGKERTCIRRIDSRTKLVTPS